MWTSNNTNLKLKRKTIKTGIYKLSKGEKTHHIWKQVHLLYSGVVVWKTHASTRTKQHNKLRLKTFMKNMKILKKKSKICKLSYLLEMNRRWWVKSLLGVCPDYFNSEVFYCFMHFYYRAIILISEHQMIMLYYLNGLKLQKI